MDQRLFYSIIIFLSVLFFNYIVPKDSHYKGEKYMRLGFVICIDRVWMCSTTAPPCLTSLTGCEKCTPSYLCRGMSFILYKSKEFQKSKKKQV